MISAFLNCLKIPELRQRIIFTLSMLFVARFGANIPLPGLDPVPLQNFFADQTAKGGGGLLGMYNMFTGGALLKGAVCALGIMPYISASIIFQLMGAVVPSLARLQQEGETGRQKLQQYTRYATIVICLVQGALLILALENPTQLFGSSFSVEQYGSIVLLNKWTFLVTSIIILTGGTMLLTWLGDQITKNGIGQGVSLLITVGIVADLPSAIAMLPKLFIGPLGESAQLQPAHGVLLIVLLFAVICGITAVTQAQRKIPVQYAKRVVGRKVYGGQSSFLPLKVNYSGVMPIIFASAIILFFQQVSAMLSAAADMPFLRDFSEFFLRGSFTYYLFYSFLILTFSYFWVSVTFKPVQMADDLKKNGGYVPGVRPGEPTAKFLDFVMTRLTLAGAIFLTLIAIFPDGLLYVYRIPYQIGQFFGGTGMLIAVGVTLDTLRQVETFLLQRHYDGFMKKGRIRGRSVGRTRHSLMENVESKNLNIFFYFTGITLTSGLIAWILSFVLFK